MRADGRLRGHNLRDLPWILVLLAAGAGPFYIAVAPKHWLRGVLILAGAMLLGAVLRLVLPARRAGPLAVRSRAFDVVCYLGSAVMIVTLGLWLRHSGQT